MDHFIDIQASRVILDNLSIKGNIKNQQSIFGILADNQKDITFNNLEIFNVYDAIKLSHTENILLSNSKILNVNRGINLEEAQNTILDSMLVFNDTEGLIVQ
ncbi:MAG: NosD domain-containing protein [bacterium]